MKAFCAIALSLVPGMLAAGLKRPIILAFSYDEEIGCLGAPRMISEIVRQLPKPAAVIVGEPTMMRVIDGHKGIASFRTNVTGYTTHSSQTHRGVSAVEGAARLIASIVAMREDFARKADPSSPFTPPHTTLSVNVVRGGAALNVMAGECAFEWDCRTAPGDRASEVLATFELIAKDIENAMRAVAPQCRVETVQLSDVPGFAPCTDNPAADLAKALTGHNVTDVVAYAAEAGQFQEAGLPTVICGPGSIDQAHQPNEFIALQQIDEGTRFIRRLCERLAS